MTAEETGASIAFSVDVDLDDEDGRAAGMTRLRLLCIASTEPAWTNLTLQLDAIGCHEPRFRWVSTANEALAALRNECFDCILIGCLSDFDRQLGFVAGPLIQAIRASGQSEPIVLLASRASDRLLADACNADCEVLAAPHPWDSAALVPVIRRALARAELIRENHRLSIAHRRRLVHERDEAEHLLRQQREIIQELHGFLSVPEEERSVESDEQCIARRIVADQVADKVEAKLPPEFSGYYQELLRTYVMMGSGNLGSEIERVAELLALAGLTPTAALELHLARVESLVNGLGNRSTRHVMARADLLALELMVRLGECYQRQAPAAVPMPDTSFGGLAEAASRIRREAGSG